jgi:pSer/pThr/pTyr-binding forkhead associated (FHA) protein
MQAPVGPGFVLLVVRIAFVALVYLFLWAALRYLWRSLREAVALPRPGPLFPRARLVLVSGSHPSEGDEIALGAGVHSIGRAETCTIQIPNRFVSRLHAEIRYQEGRFWLVDHNSRNGTTVNDRLVAEPVALDEGDRIGIGGTVLELRMG